MRFALTSKQPAAGRFSLLVMGLLASSILAVGSPAAARQVRSTTVSGVISINGAGIDSSTTNTLPLRRVKVDLYLFETCPIPFDCESGDHFLLRYEDQNGDTLQTFTDDDGRFTLTFDIDTRLFVTGVSAALGITLEDRDGLLTVHDQSQDPAHPACLLTAGMHFNAGDPVDANVQIAVGSDNGTTYTARTRTFTPATIPIGCDETLAAFIPYVPATGSSNAGAERFGHLAVMYHRVHTAAVFAQEELGLTLWEAVRVQGWDSVNLLGDLRGGMSYESCESRAPRAIHVPDRQSMLQPAEATTQRDLFNLRHEYGHHVMCLSSIAGQRDDAADNDVIGNHEGLANRTSGDSWNEGFATYFAVTVAKSLNEPDPEVVETEGGVLDLKDGDPRIDNPRLAGQADSDINQMRYGTLAEEVAIARVLWEADTWLGRDRLWDVLTNNVPDLETFKDVYDALAAAWHFAQIGCDFLNGATTRNYLDCMMVERGFYHDADGDGLYDTGELIGVTRWPLGARPSVYEAERTSAVQRPAIPIIPGSEMRLMVENTAAEPLDGVQLDILLEYESPLESANYRYTRNLTGSQPHLVPIIVPGSPSRAVVRAVKDGHQPSEAIVIERNFYHDAINPYRAGGVAEILLEHRFTLRPNDTSNLAPTADAGGPYAGVEGAPVTVDAGLSTDPNTGDTLTYSFDCQDDGAFEAMDRTAAAFDCTYPDDGGFTVRVRVSDQGGLSHDASSAVGIGNLPPTADAGGPYACAEGAACSVGPGSAVDVPADPLRYAWDCDGDLIYETPGQTAVCSPFPDGPATASVTLQVCDDEGACTTSGASVAVSNVPPAVLAGPDAEIILGASHVVSAGFTDPGLDGPWSFTINWGDGTEAAGSTSDTATPIVESHHYLVSGRYDVKVRVTDRDGGTGRDSLVVVVTRPSLLIDIKPGDPVNTINDNSQGVIPVAILTAGGFDATTVDPMSIRFGPGGARERHFRGHVEDADGDGDLDMVLHFGTQESGLVTSDVQACLTGQTVNGAPLSGCDAVRVAGGQEAPPPKPAPEM